MSESGNGRGRIDRSVSLPPEQLALLGYWGKLEEIHRAYDRAAKEITSVTGQPLCIENCGRCCNHASVISLGIEAEHVASWLLGQPQNLKPTLDRIREWLTKPGQYSYGKALTPEWLGEHFAEFARICSERCCLLGDDNRCTVYWPRPMVCRSYGVTHMPDRWCPRPVGLGEDAGSRAWWNPKHPKIPLHQMVESLKDSMGEARYIREGFFVSMLFERLAAGELAGLLDDGKVPMLKLANGIGGSMTLLWQDQLDSLWTAQAADRSIANQVPLKDTDGQLHMVIGGKA